MERDIRLAKSGDVNDLVYKTLVGLKLDMTTVDKPEVLEETLSHSGCSSSSGESNDDEDDDDETSKFVDSSRPKKESLDEKKMRKKAVKEAQAEKRKIKIKKHVKKRKEKIGKK